MVIITFKWIKYRIDCICQGGVIYSPICNFVRYFLMNDIVSVKDNIMFSKFLVAHDIFSNFRLTRLIYREKNLPAYWVFYNFRDNHYSEMLESAWTKFGGQPSDLLYHTLIFNWRQRHRRSHCGIMSVLNINKNMRLSDSLHESCFPLN